MSIPWPPVGVRQRLLELRSTRDALRELKPSDDSYAVAPHMARYLTVRAAGYVEAVRDDVADHFTTSRTSDEVVRRVREHLRTGEGVRPGQLERFITSFSPDWAAEFKEMLEANDDALKSSLGALVAARKKVAHGDGENISTSKALTWCETAEQVGQWLITRFDPALAPTVPTRHSGH